MPFDFGRGLGPDGSAILDSEDWGVWCFVEKFGAAFKFLENWE